MAEIKKISTELQILNKFLDTSGDAGTSQKILRSTGTGVDWFSGFSSVYTVGTVGSGAAWRNMGTFTASQGGKSIFIKIVSNNGYNATISQNYEVYIRFKTSNGGSTDANGFAADSSFYTTGPSGSLGGGNIKWVADAAGTSATAYTLYVLFPQFTGDGSFYVAENSTGTWVNSGATATDPGAASSTILIPQEQFRVGSTDFVVNGGGGDAYFANSNVGIGTSSPANKLVVETSTAGDYAALINNIHGTTGYGLLVRTSSTGTSAYALAARAGSNDIFVVRADGNVGIGDPSPTSISANTFSLSVNSSRNDLSGALISKANGTVKHQQYWDSSGYSFNLSAGAFQFNGGNVGIGTTSPQEPLDVNTNYTGLNVDNTAAIFGNDIGTTQSRDTWIKMRASSQTTDRSWAFGTQQSGNFTFNYLADRTIAPTNAAASTLLTIKNTGNVGIGTTSPLTKLHIAGTTDANIIRIENTSTSLSLGSTIGAIQFFNNDPTDNSPNVAASIYATAGASGGSGSLRFKTTEPGTEGDPATDTMIITNGGNVGIGVTSPTAKLHVAGSTRVTGDLYFDTTSTALYKIKKDGTSLQIWGNATVPAIEVLDTGVLKLGTYALSGLGTPTHLLGVTSTGQVVKTTSGSDLPGGPYLPLSAGSSYPLTGDLYLDDGSGATPSLYFKNGANNFWRYLMESGGDFSIKEGTSTRLTFKAGGNVGIGETSPDSKLHIHQTGSGTLTTIITEDDARKLFIGRDAINCKDLNNNAAILYLNQAGGNVAISNSLGIGTTSPSEKLEVVGDIKTSGTGNTQVILESGGACVMDLLNAQSEAYLRTTSAHDLYFRTTNINRMVIKAAGKVGIGTTSPNDLLEIEGDADVYARVHYTGNGSNSPADVCGIKLEHGRATWNIRNTYNGGVSYPDGAFSINSGTKANALTILNNTSSDIGIGTNAPTAKLHVNGSDFLVSNGGEEAINVDLDNYVYKFGDISGGENQSYFGISSANAQAYFLNCNVGIGTSSPNVPLDVTVSDTGSSFNDGAVQLSNTTSASSGGATVMNIRNNYGGGFGTLIKFFRTSTSSSIANISFNSGGTAVNYNTGSDYRLKEDLQTFNGLDILSNISVYNYKWKGVDFRGYGVIAHELQPIFPDAVTGEKDAEEMQSVDYSKLVPVLIKSVQELKKEIELLKQQLNK